MADKLDNFLLEVKRKADEMGITMLIACVNDEESGVLLCKNPAETALLLVLLQAAVTDAIAHTMLRAEGPGVEEGDDQDIHNTRNKVPC